MQLRVEGELRKPLHELGDRTLVRRRRAPLDDRLRETGSRPRALEDRPCPTQISDHHAM